MSDPYDGIQVTHELTVEGYRITVFEKNTGKFVLTWLMDPREALDMGHQMVSTVVSHTQDVISIIEKGAQGG